MNNYNDCELWKPVIGFEALYEVSNTGNVKSIRNNIILKPYKTGKNSGYYTVDLRNGEHSKQAKVHRLVAEAFIPNPEMKPQVNHIDGNKDNNNVSNLEWCTNKENMEHAATNGLMATGERSPSAKLTSDQVSNIRKEYVRGLRGHGAKILAKKYGVSDMTIRQIVHMEKWKHEIS